MKTVDDMTKKDFQALRLRKHGEKIGDFDSLIIIPTRKMHDSGYRCMEFVAVKDGKPLCRMSGGSDVIHLGGIAQPLLNPMKVGWHIDCLAKSGYLRIFSHQFSFTVGADLSSFELFLGSPR